MPGTEAIIATGSLKVAVIAPTIVFISLSLLAVIVGILEKVLRLYDQIVESLFNVFRSKGDAAPGGASTKELPHVHPNKIAAPPLTQEEKQATHFLEMIAQRLGESFTLTKLEAVGEERGIGNCGDLIRHLVDLETIKESEDPGEAGCYRWKGTSE